MSIRRYKADSDTTITDAYKADLMTVATGSNMGLADTMEVFSIYAQAEAESVERSRILVKFPIDDIVADRDDKVIPDSGKVNFVLKLYNAVHPFTLPENFTVEVSRVTLDWDEGHGLDMEEYSDAGANGNHVDNQFGGTGASWNVASTGVDWTSAGGDFDNTTYGYTFEFDEGDEDLELDITDMVEDWVDSTNDNYGIMVRLVENHEDGSEERSYYTKKFFARGSQYFYKRPIIEAQWDSSETDNRNNFYAVSNLRLNNSNIISLKNYVDGVLTNIPNVTSLGPNDMTIKFYEDDTEAVEVVATVSVSNAAAGVYTAKITVDTELSDLFLVWQDQAGERFHTETINVKKREVGGDLPIYVTAMQNLKSVYSVEEQARFRLFIRLKDWSPTIYTVASKELDTEIVEDAYYRIVRVVDDLVVIDWGAEETEYTKLSYDKDGCFFDLDMSLFEPNWSYRIELMYKVNGELRQQPETFKFRVE